MASPITILQSGLVIGRAKNSIDGMMLDMTSSEPQALSLGEDQGILVNFISSLTFNTSGQLSIEQFMALFDCLFSEQLQCPEDECVLLVLPELFNGQDELLHALFAQIAVVYPHLLTHSLSRIFPYGSSGNLMALAEASRLLSVDAVEQVWIIAMDSLAEKQLLLQLAQQQRLLTEQHMGLCPSEGIVGLCLGQSEIGLVVNFSAMDADVEGTPKQALTSLFTQISAESSDSLQAIYFPDNGDETLTQQWLDAYPLLSAKIGQHTQLLFPAYHTGEIGTAGGLYRFLHIFEGFKNGLLSGNILQCEISAKAFRAAGLFSWRTWNGSLSQQGS